MPIILIADDEPVTRQLIRETLSIDPTLSFVEVKDGVAALEAARVVHPHLIILDIMMPKMDGLQVCRLLKADTVLHAIPVIVMTAHLASGSELVAREAGADGFIRKPFEEAGLLTTVDRLLQSRTGN